MPEMQFHCMDITLANHVTMDFKRNDAFLEFGCLLSGCIRGCTWAPNRREAYFGGGPGLTWCSFQSGVQGSIEYLAGEPISVLLFQIHGDLLKSLLSMARPRPSLAQGQTGAKPFNSTGNLNPGVKQIVNQVMGAGMTADPSAKLLLISKAYELLAHFSVAAQAAEEDAPSRHNGPVTDLTAAPPLDNGPGVEQARDILVRNLAEPPSLADIARQSGLCVTSLTKEFRKRFGTTVFGYLRQRRLARAKELMALYGMSASEAAWEVGYSSLSSFNRAFSARYGTTPGAFSRKVGKRASATTNIENGIWDK